MADPEESGPTRDGVPETPPQGVEEVVPIAQVRELQATNETLQARVADLERWAGELAQELEASRAGLSDAQRLGLEHLRRALLAEHRGQVVPELIAGATAEELLTSLETARAAFDRAAEAARQQLQTQQVPVGNSARDQQDLAALPPVAKIAHGLSRG